MLNYTPCEIKLRKARSFDISSNLFDLKKSFTRLKKKKKMEMTRYDNVLRLILFQKEFYFNYLKKRQSILTLILLAIKRRKKLLILQCFI